MKSDNGDDKPIKDNEVNEAETHAAIAALYRMQATEMPSEALDAQILATARLANNVSAEGHEVNSHVNTGSKSIWQAYRWPLSTAASVLLVSSLLLLSPELRHELLTPDDISLEMSPRVLMENAPAPAALNGPDNATMLKRAAAPSAAMSQADDSQVDNSQAEMAVEAASQMKREASERQAVEEKQQAMKLQSQHAPAIASSNTIAPDMPLVISENASFDEVQQGLMSLNMAISRQDLDEISRLSAQLDKVFAHAERHELDTLRPEYSKLVEQTKLLDQ